MITLDGCYGKGALWGVFCLYDKNVSPWTNETHLFNYSSPSEWYLPPSDSVWYDCQKSPYGPRIGTLEVGWINSTSNDEFNPCEHSTIRGNALYHGYAGLNLPYLLNLPTKIVYSGFWEVSPVDQRSFTGKRIAIHHGPLIPKSGATKAYNRFGDVISLLYYNAPEGYWNTNTTLFPNRCNQQVASAIPLGLVSGNYGQWMGRDIVTGGIPSDPQKQSRYFTATVNHSQRTVFSRVMYREYHDTSSYTPPDSVSHAAVRTALGYLICGECHYDIYTITHIRSTKDGVFFVRVAQKNVCDREGWEYGKGYYKTHLTSIQTYETTLNILAPGRTTATYPNFSLAKLYCQTAVNRASTLYDHEGAKAARTEALRDVTALDSNWIENLAGVPGTMDVLNPLIDGAKAVEAGDFAAARKALAAAYLVYSYAVAPSVSDAGDLKSNAVRIVDRVTKHRFSDERRRGLIQKRMVPVCDTLADLTYTCTYRLRLKTNYFSQIWNALEKLGLDPSAGQLWDLIPYSFVADWFLPIGESLRNISAYNSMRLNRDVTARIDGFKVQWPLSNELINTLFLSDLVNGGEPLSYTWYDRRVSKTIGDIDPIGASSSDGLSVSQMAQGSALITQYF